MMPFSQVEVIPGWFSVVLQGGSFAVLAYLMIIGLPKAAREGAQDRTNERDRFTAELREQRKDYTDTLNLISKTFKDEALAERLSCEKHFATLADSMSKGNEVTVQAVKTILQQIQAHAERNQQWLELLKTQLEATQKKQ